jgi:hypothetical protein
MNPTVSVKKRGGQQKNFKNPYIYK